MPHLLLPSLLLLMTCTSGLMAETITVRADLWAPYNAQPDSDHPGTVIEMTKEIFAAHGITIDYQLLPWPRAVQACKNGEIDAIVGSMGKEFDGIVIGTQPVATATSSLIGLAEQKFSFADSTDFAALDQIQIAYPRGYNFTADIDAYLRSPTRTNITEVGGEEPLIQAVALLEHKRVDAYIEDYLVFFAALPDEKKAHFKVLGQMSQPIPFYIAFSPTKPQATHWAELLDQGLVELKRTGRYTAILARYGIIEPATAAVAVPLVAVPTVAVPLSAPPAP